MVSWQPISALRPPLCLAPSLLFARSGSLSAAAGGGGEMEREEGSGDRAGGRGRRGVSSLRVGVKELEKEKRESLLLAWLSRREVSWLPLQLPPRSSKGKETEDRETQGDTESCLCGEVQGWLLAARLPRLFEDSQAGFLLGKLSKDTETKGEKQLEISSHDWEQEEGGGSLKSWTSENEQLSMQGCFISGLAEVMPPGLWRDDTARNITSWYLHTQEVKMKVGCGCHEAAVTLSHAVFESVLRYLLFRSPCQVHLLVVEFMDVLEEDYLISSFTSALLSPLTLHPLSSPVVEVM
ncbi:hypothetical protein CRENBAI_002308 [Crenichthys baileyi]|uniref:Uncharacterized protein n=1 Tax=Crenichthys baileyi TaxID=28760 RepID=A0AAV9QXV6_9TELE